jgi:hypothetical protein
MGAGLLKRCCRERSVAIVCRGPAGLARDLIRRVDWGEGTVSKKFRCNTSSLKHEVLFLKCDIGLLVLQSQNKNPEPYSLGCKLEGNLIISRI